MTVTWRDDIDGTELSAGGDTLAELAAALLDAGYTGGSLRVTDEPGFTVGWVSAGQWRAA